jgi:DNA adenine methylase
MNYMGSKSAIAKYILPIIQQYINKYKIDTYIEPFVGGANVIDRIDANVKIGSDINKYLIALLDHVSKGEPLLGYCNKELYDEVRDFYNRKSDNNYADWFVGEVGFLASFNGRFFDGGYAKSGFDNGKFRDYYKEHYTNLMSQDLKGIDFRHCDYHEYADYNNCLFYCDPPYADTKEYATSFDSEKFFEFARKLSQNNIVIISELSAPDDFIEIWKMPVSRNINACDKFTAIEKMFIHESNKNYIIKRKRLF